MDKINNIWRGLLFQNEIAVALLDTTQLVNVAIDTHRLSPLAAAALGRVLTVATYMSSTLKDENDGLSIAIHGDGVGGSIHVSGNQKLQMRGYIENPVVDLPFNCHHKLNVGGCVGKNGTLTVIYEENGKLFTGTTNLVSGEIGEDFVEYFLQSEQRNTAISVGVKIDTAGKCIAAGGLFLQVMPSASETSIAQAEQLFQNFTHISTMLEKQTMQEIWEKFIQVPRLYEGYAQYQCTCNREYIQGVLVAVGQKQLQSILKEDGKISVYCHYCNKNHDFFDEDIKKLFTK